MLGENSTCVSGFSPGALVWGRISVFSFSCPFSFFSHLGATVSPDGGLLGDGREGRVYLADGA